MQPLVFCFVLFCFIFQCLNNFLTCSNLWGVYSWFVWFFFSRFLFNWGLGEFNHRVEFTFFSFQHHTMTNPCSLWSFFIYLLTYFLPFTPKNHYFCLQLPLELHSVSADQFFVSCSLLGEWLLTEKGAYPYSIADFWQSVSGSCPAPTGASLVSRSACNTRFVAGSDCEGAQKLRKALTHTMLERQVMPPLSGWQKMRSRWGTESSWKGGRWPCDSGCR